VEVNGTTSMSSTLLVDVEVESVDIVHQRFLARLATTPRVSVMSREDR
jgi:hypothetical protein